MILLRINRSNFALFKQNRQENLAHAKEAWLGEGSTP